MKRLKIFSVLVAVMFCVGIVIPAFADNTIQTGTNINSTLQEQQNLKPNQAYKAPKTVVKKTKNSIKISKGTQKITINTKGLTPKQKKELQKYVAKLAKQFDKKYEKNANPKTVAQIVKNIAKKVNNKAKDMRLDNQITAKYGAKGLKQVNNIVETTGISKKNAFKILKQNKVTKNELGKVANEARTLVTNEMRENSWEQYTTTGSEYLRKAISNVKKGIKTKLVPEKDGFDFS